MQEDGEDVVMKDESAGLMACNECLDQKQVTIFCTRACADRNLAAHRRMHHGARTDGNVHDLVSPVSQLISLTLKDEKTGLKFKT